MRFNIDPKIFEQHRDLKIGVILIKNFENNRRNSNVESLLRGICAQRGKEFENKDMHADPMIKAWEQAYGKFGINPNKYPPSIAALTKRVSKGHDIPHINLLVDLYNYFSLKHMLPVGGEDLDWLAGDLTLTFTHGKEAFRPIGSIDVEEAKEGEVAYMDKGGITCRYWNHRECERTKFTTKTVNAAIFVEDLSNMHMDKFGGIIDEMAESMAKYVGGTIETYIMNEDNPSIDLGIEGRQKVNDAKVSKQEKAHFKRMEEAKKKLKKSSSKPKSPQPQKTSKISSRPSEELPLEDETLLKNKIQHLVEMAITLALPKAKNPIVHIEYPASPDHGDYACNIAMRLAKELKLKPQTIAERIIKKIKIGDLIEKAEMAGPGFINFFVSFKALSSTLKDIIKEKDAYGSSLAGKKKPIIVEYSGPNIAKPLGVHHLLSTIIGQSLYDIYKYIGFDAISINHIGDWGTQFGKLIVAYKKWGDKTTVEKDPIAQLLKLYVKFHDEAEKDPKLEDEARKEFKIFEDGDKENKKLWKWFVDESMKEIESTYEKLGGIHFDHTQGESFYEDKMGAILEDGKRRNLFEKGEEGAYVVHYDDPNIAPLVVQKKDGATIYATRDFATMKYRIDTWHPVKILYVVDVSHSLYFKQLFTASERFPWYHGEAVHVVFGRMRMKDSSMSTRKGTVILLDEVIDEAVKRATKIVEEKSPDLKNKEEVGRIIGIGAIKYNVLSQNRTTDITFDWDRMLSVEGNSAPYLQYSYARARSILRKSEGATDIESSTTPKETDDVKLKINALVRLLPKFKEQLLISAKEYKPNILCNYLYELAQAFNSFYNSVPVLKCTDEKEKNHRLQLVEAASQILKNGLALLGIEVVEEM